MDPSPFRGLNLNTLALVAAGTLFIVTVTILIFKRAMRQRQPPPHPMAQGHKVSLGDVPELVDVYGFPVGGGGADADADGGKRGVEDWGWEDIMPLSARALLPGTERQPNFTSTSSSPYNPTAARRIQPLQFPWNRKSKFQATSKSNTPTPVQTIQDLEVSVAILMPSPPSYKDKLRRAMGDHADDSDNDEDECLDYALGMTRVRVQHGEMSGFQSTFRVSKPAAIAIGCITGLVAIGYLFSIVARRRRAVRLGTAGGIPVGEREDGRWEKPVLVDAYVTGVRGKEGGVWGDLMPLAVNFVSLNSQSLTSWFFQQQKQRPEPPSQPSGPEPGQLEVTVILTMPRRQDEDDQFQYALGIAKIAVLSDRMELKGRKR
ncbi:hypothetical protein BXZ70DRAFT_910224 [Cristinia sonorae]|uniref:Uncharacterized protein n=1 Tax=Cristinia sonorae TaxID=1940300 RepID=A0A8K0XLQ8_9AGAR|nr:hypothetical protein BXZ70DRAFT_910224 [Cristinia sonorae]